MGSIGSRLKPLRDRFFHPTVSRLQADINDFAVTFKRLKVDAPKLRPKGEEAHVAGSGGDNSSAQDKDKEPQLGQEDSWIAACNAHLDHARAALEARDVGGGYQSLQSAQRESVSGMPQAERSALVVSLRHEVEKKLKDSWRGKAAKDLLGEEEPSIEQIKEVLLHLNTDSQNTYRKVALLRNQLITLGVLILGLLVTGIIASRRGALSILCDQPDCRGSRLLAFAIYSGLLGGALSAALSVSRPDPTAKIPDVQRTRWIALTRSFVGAGAAVPVFLLVQGEVINLGKGTPNTWALLFFCFLAGFSERWFLGTIESFAKDKSQPPQD